MENREYNRYQEMFLGLYASRMVDSGVVALQSFIVRCVPENERNGFILKLNSSRNRFGLMPIYADFIVGGLNA